MRRRGGERVLSHDLVGAQITLQGLGKKFENATEIMAWLAQCARVVASEGHCVEWITPLGLPVIQPYRKRVRATCIAVMCTENVVQGGRMAAGPAAGTHVSSLLSGCPLCVLLMLSEVLRHWVGWLQENYIVVTVLAAPEAVPRERQVAGDEAAPEVGIPAQLHPLPGLLPHDAHRARLQARRCAACFPLMASVWHVHKPYIGSRLTACCSITAGNSM